MMGTVNNSFGPEENGALLEFGRVARKALPLVAMSLEGETNSRRRPASRTMTRSASAMV